MTHRIAVIPGDGIGKEVVPEGVRVLEVLDRANRELGTLTVVITHNVAIAAMADRVIRISSGAILDIRENAKRASPAELAW